jgi:hypothetical protein
MTRVMENGTEATKNLLINFSFFLKKRHHAILTFTCYCEVTSVYSSDKMRAS